MKNYKMVISYDGSAYKGWQRLGDTGKTIQGILEKTIGKIIGESVEIIGSGRTDAGVHARGQVANFRVARALDTFFLDKLNRALPEDIQVRSCVQVPDDFRSRYASVAKRYKYYVNVAERPSVFDRKYVYHLPCDMEMDVMRQAVKCLIGTHDFSAFTDDKTERSKVRTIHDIQIRDSQGNIEFEYYGDGFLMHMIRILTGTLLEVGMGQKRAEDVPIILKEKKRENAGFLVPAKGLFLEKVDYS